MKIEYMAVDTGEVLDVVLVPGSGPIQYRTGAAQGKVRSIEKFVGSRSELIAALRGWTNGYTQMREVEA